MEAILVKSVVYYSIENVAITLAVGTHVLIDLDDGTASHKGDNFDIEPDEYEMARDNFEMKQPASRLGLH